MMHQLCILVPVCLLFLSCASTAPERTGRPGGDPAVIRSPGEIISEASPSDWLPLDPELTLYLDVPDGRIVIALSSLLARNHVAQIKELTRARYFDGLRFYRVIEGFVAQVGARGEETSADRSRGAASDSLTAEFDQAPPAGMIFTPLGNQDGYAAEAGFTDGFPAGRDLTENRVWLAHCAGALAFARGNSPNSASATIYITLQPQRYLDRNLTVVGRVVWGMEYVQSIKRATEGGSGYLENASDQTPIVSARIAADLPQKERVALEILDTSSAIFAELIEARQNRPEEFFVQRPDHVDLCQMPIPVRSR
jgi:peptidylprolyl isomerase